MEKILKKLNNALNANDYESARKIIENDIKRQGKKEEYYFYLALISSDLNKKLELYSKALDIKSDYLDALINRGLVKNELQDYEGSIDDYTNAIKLDQKCALAYNNRGYTKYKMQKFEAALKDYNKAILLNPKLKIAIDNKAKLLNEVCLKDDENFSEKFYLSMGITEINMGNIPEGINNLDEALKYNKESDLAWFYKGAAYQCLGQDEKAIDAYTQSIKINKNMIDAYYNRGKLLFKTEPKKALDDFVTSVALDPKFLDAYYSIAAIQKNMGQFKEAIQNLNKIIEIEPNAVNAKALKKLIETKYLK